MMRAIRVWYRRSQEGRRFEPMLGHSACGKLLVNLEVNGFLRSFESDKDRAAKGADWLRLSYAVLKIQLACSPQSPFGHLAMGNLDQIWIKSGSKMFILGLEFGYFVERSGCDNGEFLLNGRSLTLLIKDYVKQDTYSRYLVH